MFLSENLNDLRSFFAQVASLSPCVSMKAVSDHLPLLGFIFNAKDGIWLLPLSTQRKGMVQLSISCYKLVSLHC